MSLTTLLEAAKYLDYLDSSINPTGQQQQHHHHQQQQQQQASSQHHQRQLPNFHHQQTSYKQLVPIQKPSRRRSSKNDAANTMLAMSLPASTRPMGHNSPNFSIGGTPGKQIQGVPIPLMSNASHQAASLSSSFTTGSPLSSFASTALLCSKGPSLSSSSESSSSCGEILMGDNDFNHQSPLSASTGKQNNGVNIINNNNNNNNYNNITHLKFENIQPNPVHATRYIAATSAGPQLVTMTTNSTMASSSAPSDGSIRAGHVIHAANTSFDSRHFSLSNGLPHRTTTISCHDGQTFNLTANSFASGDNHQLSVSPNSGPPFFMARVQPMILNSVSPSAQTGGLMAFQASSPTSSSSSYSRHRELHKTLEKNRRAHLRHCFELLKAELPVSECVDKKTSHINIIKSAIRYVLALRQQECEIDNELQRLTKRKNELTESLSKLRQHDQQPPQQQQADLQPLQSPTQQQQQPQQDNQQPAAEQQLSFLLSRSKID